jgi:hypothetical protein
LEIQQQELIDRSLHAKIIINAIDSKGLYTDDLHIELPNIDQNTLQRMMRLSAKQNDTSKDVMAMLTRSTGGLFFENNNDLTFGFRELGMIPNVSYLLAFLPQEPPNGKYHSLKVRLKSRSNYMIQARAGYYASANKSQARGTSERRIDGEILRSDAVNELAAVITSEASRTNAGTAALDVVINIDARRFHFVEKDNLWRQNLVFVATLFTDAGDFVTGTELNVKFALKKETFTRMAETGIEMSVTLEAPPGLYRLRGVAQDGLDGKVVASSSSVQIR